MYGKLGTTATGAAGTSGAALAYTGVSGILVWAVLAFVLLAIGTALVSVLPKIKASRNK